MALRDRPVPSVLRFVPLAAVVAVGSLLLLQTGPSAAEQARVVPSPALDETPEPGRQEVAVFAGGCFWGVQGVFQHVNGVTKAVSGYAGGRQADADYEAVSEGGTGHAESVQVTFDPAKVTYGQLLQIYFSVAHDPTELNRQGPDRGTQYRSALFPVSPDQERVARAYIAQLGQAHAFDAPIVTRVETGRTFYPAEGYHQDFLTLNPGHPYIVVNDLPKIANLQRMFGAMYRLDPVLVGAGRSPQAQGHAVSAGL